MRSGEQTNFKHRRNRVETEEGYYYWESGSMSWTGDIRSREFFSSRLILNQKGTMNKQNCWEATRCGREPSGSKSGEQGICPASEARAVDGLNNGKNGGRACWAIPGTLCGGEVWRYETQKWGECRRCSFFWKVHREAGASYAGAGDIMEKKLQAENLSRITRSGNPLQCNLPLARSS